MLSGLAMFNPAASVTTWYGKGAEIWSPLAAIMLIQNAFVGSGAAWLPQKPVGFVAVFGIGCKFGMAVDSGADEITVDGSTVMAGGPASAPYMNPELDAPWLPELVEMEPDALDPAPLDPVEPLVLG